MSPRGRGPGQPRSQILQILHDPVPPEPAVQGGRGPRGESRGEARAASPLPMPRPTQQAISQYEVRHQNSSQWHL